jgi:predicted enzyme related to lactoylglutathione lyase
MVKTGDDKQIGIDGNLMKKIPGQAYGIINYVEVSSVDEFSKKIITEGGKTIMPKTPIPAIGHIALFADVEKNTFGIIQLDSNVK